MSEFGFLVNVLPRPGVSDPHGRPRTAGPELPVQIVADTRRRYVTAFERITGASFERYLQEDTIVR